ncbi:venom carboxylesterase-6-like isoform X2 [Euwallacea fornicatus]|uniref:venom carboxylesterase-6-like isoform X2 n=1 Tax=Euwallacea fornicatus TaxID=995702 RepID=UPI00338DFEED
MSGSNNFIVLFLFVLFVGVMENLGQNTMSYIQIKVKNGPLRGTINHLKDGQSYYSFLGIPYAQPPIGKLRFKDPLPYQKWKGILNATQYGPKCVEMTLRQITYEVSGQEDCLYLNVFVPSNQVNNKKPLPVMFWIYGGSFREGSSDIYGPQLLLQQNVVVVSFNYRLGFFGFLSTEDEEAPGNYGIKDIIQALKWVKSNIFQFGGDPNTITLFGESAGSAIVGYLIVAKQIRGLFNAVIMQSGSPLCPWALQKNARKVAFDLGLAMGITTNNSSALITYLRSVDFSNAHTALINVNLLNFLDVFENGGPFGPVIEPESDTALLTKDIYKALKNGDFYKVPVLMGVNSQESKFLNSMLSFARSIFILYDISPRLLVRSAMNVKSFKDQRVVGMKIKRHYFKFNSFFSGDDSEFADFFSDDLFVRPITKTAQFLSRYVPVYFYVFDYEGEIGEKWVNFASTYNKNVKGVAHATDLWYLWIPKWLTENFSMNVKDEATSKLMVKLWTNFATFRNPTPEAENTFHVKWPKMKSSKMDYFYIGEDIRIGKDFKGTNMRFWEELYSNYSKGPVGTY